MCAPLRALCAFQKMCAPFARLRNKSARLWKKFARLLCAFGKNMRVFGAPSWKICAPFARLCRNCARLWIEFPSTSFGQYFSFLSRILSSRPYVEPNSKIYAGDTPREMLWYWRWNFAQRSFPCFFRNDWLLFGGKLKLKSFVLLSLSVIISSPDKITMKFSWLLLISLSPTSIILYRILSNTRWTIS